MTGAVSEAEASSKRSSSDRDGAISRMVVGSIINSWTTREPHELGRGIGEDFALCRTIEEFNCIREE